MSEKRFEIHPKKFKIHERPNRFEITKVRYAPDTLLSEVKQIQEGGLAVERAEDLDRLVEAPLLEACKILYRKGIQTVFSSANRADIARGFAYIVVDVDSLAESNKETALRMGETRMMHGSVEQVGIWLKIPVNDHTTVGDVETSAIEIANRFEQQ
jgi:hypothetical protein